MNKMIPFLVGLLLLSGVVLAVPFPVPVIVNSQGGYGCEVKITNLNTGKTFTTTKDIDDNMLIEWGNIGSAFNGDEFKAEISGNTDTDVYEGLDVQFSLGRIIDCTARPIETIITVPSECNSCPATECFNPSCPSCNCGSNTCPEVICEGNICKVEPCTEKLCPTCETCPAVPECPVLPEGYSNADMMIAVSLMSLIGVGAGYQISVSKSGTGKVSVKITKHKHYGIIGLHSVYTVHTNPAITHEYGEVNPRYRNGFYVGVK